MGAAKIYNYLLFDLSLIIWEMVIFFVAGPLWVWVIEAMFSDDRPSGNNHKEEGL